MHHTNYSTPQLQLLYITTTATTALHHPTSSSSVWGDRPGDHCNQCNHSKKPNSRHFSVHQWIRFAIRDSQRPTSPIGLLFLELPPPPCAVLLVNMGLILVHNGWCLESMGQWRPKVRGFCWYNLFSQQDDSVIMASFKKYGIDQTIQQQRHWIQPAIMGVSENGVYPSNDHQIQ